MKFQINQNSPRGGSFISSSTLAHPAIDTLQVLKLVYMYIVQTLYFDKFRKLYFIFRLQNYINVCTFLFFLLSLAINPYFQTHFFKTSLLFCGFSHWSLISQRHTSEQATPYWWQGQFFKPLSVPMPPQNIYFILSKAVGISKKTGNSMFSFHVQQGLQLLFLTDELLSMSLLAMRCV